ALIDVVPVSLLSSPKEGGVTYYNFAIGNLAQLTYTITATPATAQVGDKCGDLTLTQAGVKDATGTATVAQCW
ncbi:MAG: type IV pilin protein, partial [Pseudomonadota bacterium]